jgi:acyl-CoA reductase-like NAD-dependent aldehyde dehydrogenase
MQAPNDLSAVQRAFDQLKKAATERPWLDADAREDLLDRLIRMQVKHKDDVVAAIREDFGHRAHMESLIADILIPIDSARFARKHLREWMRRRTLPAHPLTIPSHVYVEYMPLGVVGVIAPWNYPVDLAFGPAAGAFAAGNRVLIKPSELTPKTSALIARMVRETFSAEECAVVEGGPDVARAVTALPLDHLLFTGSTQVGRLVARAAADNLVPTTLELGGKSPALVHESYSLDSAAKRIAVGKTFNGGQTCVAPDYALVPRAKLQAFVDKVKAAIIEQHPTPADFTHMASDKGLARMKALVEDAKAKGAKVVETFTHAEGRAFPPLLLLDVTDEMLVMQEEIFGPLLPVLPYDSLDEAIRFINARPRPLAFYYFDDDGDRVDDVLKRVPAGNVTVNDTLAHFAQEELPFGGVGASGMGAYHGFRGFETFSHQRGVMVSSRLSPQYNLVSHPMRPMVKRTLDFLISGLKGLTS